MENFTIPSILLCVLTAGVFAESPAEAPTEFKCDLRSWAGGWQTSYGVMKLRFDDEKFTGHYGSSRHAVSGKFDPKTPCTSFLGIPAISGLKHAVNLKTLDLSHNLISDITPLAGLTKLKRLLLYKVRITDLSPLANWKKLKSIELRLTKETNYTLLQHFPNLELLATNHRLISDAQRVALRKALPRCRLLIETRQPDGREH